jgi:hypothetical protein
MVDHAFAEQVGPALMLLLDALQPGAARPLLPVTPVPPLSNPAVAREYRQPAAICIPVTRAQRSASFHQRW